ncbi:unnamed protein product [Owenia fusiformis]|uniref:Calcineurin-like phosphoesterase domain-containing protein n=1 Tax=Owenia fusiformis TaxID=6347 RepID=A0A8S4PIW4_OWEFU|nr:unnamed protein product [Owenia fusiformis]
MSIRLQACRHLPTKMKMSMSCVFALVVILGSMEQSGADVVFAAIGDWGAGTTAQKDVAKSMAGWMDKNKGDFIVTLGDNFYSGVSDTKHKYWEDRWKKVYTQRSLQKTWYVTLGNHDHNRGKAKNQVAYSKVNSKWHLPKNYYSFTKGSGSGKVHFIMLDTTPLVKGDSRQLRWLESELKKPKGSEGTNQEGRLQECAVSGFQGGVWVHRS